MNFLHRDPAPIVVYEKLIEMNGYSSSKGSFTIDATLGRDTKFGIYVDDEEAHLIKSVTFTNAKAFKYGPYTSMSSLYDIINLKTVNFPVGDAPPFDDVSKVNIIIWIIISFNNPILRYVL